MKEQIENLISKWSDDAEFYMTQQQKSELAERLDKAIGIDERVVNSALKKVEFCMFVPVNAVKETKYRQSYVTLRNNARKRLTKSIIQSRPLKCDIEDVTQGRQDR